jgi:ADP-L-glycero-D-manno-heptose 6-epimerase
MRRILVTGGAGFIGSNIAGYLADHSKYNVAVSDHFGRDDKWRNLSHHQLYEIVRPTEQLAWLDEHKNDLEAVIHMGAVSSTTETDVDFILDQNFTLSRNLWDWCRKNEVRFIYASSAATFGGGEQGFEDGVNLAYIRTLRPLNPYGWSKQLFDQFAALTVERGGRTPPQWVGLKFYNVYGPNEFHKTDQRSVVNQIYPHAKHSRPVHLFKSYHEDYKDGEQLRDFIYVKDCVKVVQWLLDHPEVSGIFNLGTGKARSFNDLAISVFHALGKDPAISYIDMPETLKSKYQYFTQANMQSLRDAGYRDDFYSLEEGVKDYVQHYLTKENPYY